MSFFSFIVLSFFYLVITGLALKIVFFRTKSETPSLINWIQKPVVIILFTFFSTIINYIGFTNVQNETNVWVDLFQSFNSAIKFTVGEIRVNEVQSLFESDFYYRILYIFYSVSTFIFTLLIVVKLAFQNIYNSYMYVKSIYSEHRLFIVGTLDEVKMFIKTIPEDIKERVIIVLPLNLNIKIEIYDIKNILSPNFKDKKIRYSIKFLNISSDIFKRLNDKKNSFFFKRKQHTKTIVLFENPTYQMTSYVSAKQFHDENNEINGQHNFYIRNDFIQDTSYLDENTIKKSNKNKYLDFDKNIFLFSEKEALNRIFSEKFMFNEHFKNFNLIDEMKEESFVQYIFMGFNKRSKEILKHYMIRNSFPIDDNKTFNIKFKYDVFSNDVKDNADFFSTIYFRELFKKDENNEKHELIEKNNFLSGVDLSLIPSYDRHQGDIFDDQFTLGIEKIIKSYEGKSVHFYFILGLSNDYNNFDATKIIKDLFNRKYSTFNKSYTILAHLKNTELNNIKSEDNNTFSYGAGKETLDYNSIINEKETYLIKRLHLGFNSDLEKELQEIDKNETIETFITKIKKKINPISSKKISMEKYHFDSTRSAVLVLKQRLNLIGFDLKENAEIKDSKMIDLNTSFKKFNQENSNVYKKFVKIYFNNDDQKIEEEKTHSQRDEIYNYYAKRNDSIRRKLANIEHSRWVTNQIIELGWIPMRKEDFKKLFNEKIDEIINTKDFSRIIDVRIENSKKTHFCITDYENIKEIANLQIEYLNQLGKKGNDFKIRYDYYFKDFRLMDSLMYLFPFIDEDNLGSDELLKEVKEKALYYIVEKKNL